MCAVGDTCALLHYQGPDNVCCVFLCVYSFAWVYLLVGVDNFVHMYMHLYKSGPVYIKTFSFVYGAIAADSVPYSYRLH